MKTFETKEELIEEWKTNDSCPKGKNFNESCSTLQEIFEKCPTNMRLWRIFRGYNQFVEHLNYDELAGYHMANFLRSHSELIGLCDLSKMNDSDIKFLLQHKPDLLNYFQSNNTSI